jgi:signal transduction histidine kinase
LTPRDLHATALSRSRLIGPSLDTRVRIAVIGLSLAAYVCLDWLSFLHEFEGLPVTPWNPGIGLLFALLLLWGPKYGIVLFAGVILGEIVVLQTRLGWPVVLAIAGTIAGVYTAAASTIRWILGGPRINVTRIRDLGVLFLCGCAAALIVGVILSVLLFVDAKATFAETRAAAAQLVVGDIIGIAITTPLVLRFWHLRPSDFASLRRRAFAFELLLHLLALAAALWVVARDVTETEVHYFYVLFLPVVVTALRLGFDWACIALALVQFGLVGILHALGADIRSFTEFQAMMFVLTTTGLMVGAAVSERMRAQARLQALENKSAQESRLMVVNSIASGLAHELNQPMTAARALLRSSQLLLEAPDPDMARARANLGGAIFQIDHAAGVLRRIRNFVERGQPHYNTVEVADLIEDLRLLIYGDVSARAVVVEVAMEDRNLAVLGDRIQLQQVLLNLVRNGIEAVSTLPLSKRFVHVTIKRSTYAGAIEFQVRDSGPGVPEELADGLFEPLRSSKPEGLGLGLSICRTIVEAHGGRIWLHSGETGATEFRFLILSHEQ